MANTFEASEHAATTSNLEYMVSELMNKKFYGSLEIKFENGKIVHCKKTESIKI